jgi:RNA polymerase sigma factor (sigma-70 family)
MIIISPACTKINHYDPFSFLFLFSQERDREEPENTNDPATTVLGWELGRELMAALHQLSPDHRAVIELTFVEGFSYPRIASIVGCPENTVKTRMFHARRRLAQILSHIELEGARAYASYRKLFRGH